MKRFFLPHAKDGEMAEEAYSQIKAKAEADHGWPISPDRIFALHHVHNGKKVGAFFLARR